MLDLLLICVYYTGFRRLFECLAYNDKLKKLVVFEKFN